MPGLVGSAQAPVLGMWDLKLWRVDRLGRVRDGDLIQIVVDVVNLNGSVDLVGTTESSILQRKVLRCSLQRSPHPDLSPDPGMPDDTTLWAALAGG